MVKVLFEPKSQLVDSATYDITAWALPYVYGVNAYASKQNISLGGELLALQGWNPPLPENVENYGIVFQWEGIASARVVSQLLQKGIVLRYAEHPFEARRTKFNRGAIIVLKTSNQSFGKNLWNIVLEVANANNIHLHPVSSGLVDKGYDSAVARCMY